jgi:hypothetical protein
MLSTGSDHIAFLSWLLAAMDVRGLSGRRGSRHGPPAQTTLLFGPD